MKNKNGFTLIELIATILLITVSSTIVVINLQGRESSQSKSVKETSEERIKEVACDAVDSVNVSTVYGNTRDWCKSHSGSCKVTLKKLITLGLIDGYSKYDDTGTRLKDKQDSITVSVNWECKNGYCTKYCKIN